MSHGPVRVAAVTLSLAMGIAACSGSEVDPAKARQERVDQRLRASFSPTQASCIAERVDPAVIRALDRNADLDADGPVMRSYSDAVAACVTAPHASTSTTTAPATPPTTAPG